MTQNNSFIPSANAMLEKSNKALEDIHNIVKWSGVVDILNGAAARGKKRVIYRYIELDVFREEGGDQARHKLVEELCRAGYEVRYDASGYALDISWEHAGEDDQSA